METTQVDFDTASRRQAWALSSLKSCFARSKRGAITISIRFTRRCTAGSFPRTRAALLPDYEGVLEEAAIVGEAKVRLKGVLNIDYVTPDYCAQFPKAPATSAIR